LQSGNVLVGDDDLAKLSVQERARRIAVVAQNGTLPPAFSGWELVLLGRTPYLNWLGQATAEDRAIAARAMEFTQTSQLADCRVGEISGGESRRLLLARALAQDTPILLMDEPTTHLDLHHQFHFLDKLHLLAREHHKAILITLHDINLAARYTDRVMLLNNGEIVAQGSPQEVLQADLLSKVYQTPLKVLQNGGTRLIFPAES